MHGVSEWASLGDESTWAHRGVETGAAAPNTNSASAHTHSITIPTISKSASKLDLISVTPAVSNGTASRAVAGTAIAVAKAGTAVSIPNVTGATDVTAINVPSPTIVSIVPAVSVTTKPTRTVFGTSTTASKATAGTATTIVTGSAIKSASCSQSFPTISYTASYLEADEKLVLSAVTPTAVSISTSAASTTSYTPYTFSNVTVPVVSSNSDIDVANVGTAVTGIVKSNAATPSVSAVTASKVTLGTAISITPAVSNGNITPYTFTSVDVAKAGTAVNVADGSVSASGTGSDIVTAVTIGSTSANTSEAGSHSHTVNSHTHTQQ